MAYLCHEWMSLLLDKKMKKKNGLFGIEVETEVASEGEYPKDFLVAGGSSDGHNAYKTPLKNWKAVVDGSLRDFGVEFVLNGPKSLADTRAALDEFKDKLGGVNFIQKSPSTSVHVHINMMDLTMTQIVNFVMLYSYFENVLIEYSGPTRRSNLFALPLRNCDKSLSAFIRSVIGFNGGACDCFPTDEQEWKYSSLNFCPLMKHGSFEIRLFRGTTDVDLIWNWVNILNKLYDACKFADPAYWIETMRVSRESLLETIFQEYSPQLMFQSYPEMINKNIIYPVLISSSIKDWSRFEDNITQLCDLMKEEKPPEPVRPWQDEQMTLLPGYQIAFTETQEALMENWISSTIQELSNV